ncbi:MAG: hypothetical protein D8M57_11230 [Candidatus Scalindua sp. AMX11]|nr:MAG: hypothetical protein DWQ00_06755 [Candidatus Scalindua sp.]NOG83457.1 hypothetical protein [Planctomycetota bacterium]RZV72927.1 MAG: hypothetical protein EX341_13975 [Candidatus Scalindua sp. SCAELEC01]TDE64776.1 MAG: hypothetical protein D8M57_11230 [Candidatus Scalindua sp. AMX11]GJQ59842.1 MAG: hypothetical protein SCALA701_26430 [Candidatus Scalindua sp.]
MEVKQIKMEIPEGVNIIIGQTHFITSVEDFYEVKAGVVPKSAEGEQGHREKVTFT